MPLFLRQVIAAEALARARTADAVFHFSVQYLMWLFLALLVDHYLPLRIV